MDINGGGVWRIRGNESSNVSMVKDPRFLRILGIAMPLHMIWDIPCSLRFFAKEVALRLMAWVVILGLIQEGLNQTHQAQQDYLAIHSSEPSATS